MAVSDQKHTHTQFLFYFETKCTKQLPKQKIKKKWKRNFKSTESGNMGENQNIR